MLIFWLTAIIWDYFTFIVTSIILIATLAVFQEDGWSSVDELGKHIFLCYQVRSSFSTISFPIVPKHRTMKKGQGGKLSDHSKGACVPKSPTSLFFVLFTDFHIGNEDYGMLEWFWRTKRLCFKRALED